MSCISNIQSFCKSRLFSCYNQIRVCGVYLCFTFFYLNVPYRRLPVNAILMYCSMMYPVSEENYREEGFNLPTYARLSICQSQSLSGHRMRLKMNITKLNKICMKKIRMEHIFNPPPPIDS